MPLVHFDLNEQTLSKIVNEHLPAGKRNTQHFSQPVNPPTRELANPSTNNQLTNHLCASNASSGFPSSLLLFFRSPFFILFTFPQKPLKYHICLKNILKLLLILSSLKFVFIVKKRYLTGICVLFVIKRYFSLSLRYVYIVLLLLTIHRVIYVKNVQINFFHTIELSV